MKSYKFIVTRNEILEKNSGNLINMYDEDLNCSVAKILNLYLRCIEGFKVVNISDTSRNFIVIRIQENRDNEKACEYFLSAITSNEELEII